MIDTLLLLIFFYLYCIFGTKVFDRNSRVEEKYRKAKSRKKKREMENVNKNLSNPKDEECHNKFRFN